MSTTSSRDSGLGRAVLVEQCECPSAYTGTSCEVVTADLRIHICITICNFNIIFDYFFVFFRVFGGA